MASVAAIERLTGPEILARHLESLLGLDARLSLVHAKAGTPALRITTSGFAGMAQVICGQQLSVASARAIWARFAAIPGACDPHGYLGLDEATIRASGFSAGKTRTVRSVAQAVVDGELDFAQIDALPAQEAIARLVALKGIGPWTAEIYLMFCAGHPDVFPAGDLALQKAVAHALGLEGRPRPAELMALAQAWAPHRATAALLFWGYFAALKERDGIAL